MNPKAFEVTHQRIFAIVVPVMLASMTTPLIGVTDTAVIGRLGDAALLGGLAIAAVLFDLIFVSLNFLRSGTTGLTAQALGAQDRSAQYVVLNRALLLSICIGFILIALSDVLLNVGLKLMAPSDEVSRAVRTYFSIRILAAPLTLINYSTLGWLLGLGLARQGLILQVIANGVNIGLSIYLGLFKGYGIAGVAWATVIAELVASVLGFLLIWQRAGKFVWSPWHRLFDKASLKRTYSLNQDIMIRSFILLFVFSFATAQGSRLGDNILAANAILVNLFLLSAFMLDGFAIAAEQLVGRAVGARYLPAFDQAVRLSLLWSGALAVILFLVVITFGPLFIDLLTTNLVVQAEAKTYLIWAALSGIFGVVGFQMDGVFIGATWSREMRNMMILSMLAYLLAWKLFMPLWGNHGLWLALEIFLGVRGLTLLSRLKAKRAGEFSEAE